MSNCSQCSEASLSSSNMLNMQKSQPQYSSMSNNFATTTSPNTVINSLCNDHVWADEFMMSLAYNDEFFPELGASKSHLIPSELINFSSKDTLVKQINPCNPNIVWERKGGFLYVRDISLPGSPDLLFSQGGQIMMKLDSSIPSNVISAGYSAAKLTGLTEAINQLLDGDTVYANPANNNKITARTNTTGLANFSITEEGNKSLENLSTVNASGLSQGYKYILKLPIKPNTNPNKSKVMIKSLVELQIKKTNTVLNQFYYKLGLNSSHSLLNIGTTEPTITAKSEFVPVGFLTDYIQTLENTVISNVDSKLNEISLDLILTVPTGTNVTDIIIKKTLLECLFI